MKKRSARPWNQSLSFQPEVYFGIFLTALSFLSYARLPLSAQLWIGLFGLALPLAVGFLLAGKKRPTDVQPFVAPGFHSVSPWLWVLFLALLGFTRFYRLATLPFWPISDEGVNAYFCAHQARHWSWSLLWAEQRVEPLMLWALGSFFKVVPPSLFSMRLFPVVISLLTVGTAYWAARQWFQRLPSFILAWLLAFSFWELALSRTCLLVILGPLFQCLCLGWLGRVWKSKNAASQGKNLAVLGLLSGLGFYTWTNWGGFWLGLVALFALHPPPGPRGRFKILSLFVFFAGVIVLPLAWAKLGQEGMHHILSLAQWDFWKTLPLYLQALFWDGSITFPYGSNWGGFLNPLLGALALVGFLHFRQTLPRPLFYGVVASFFFVLLPGIATSGFELYRILLILPLLMILALGALGRLLSNLSRPRALAFAGALLLGSLGLDLYNYVFHYSRIQGVPALHQWRSLRYYNAYQSLQKEVRRSGPLFVFLEFNTDYDNKTLEVAGSPFRAAATDRPNQAALLVNASYLPHLLKDYPQSHFDWVESGKKEEPLFAWVYIPLSGIPPERLDRWLGAEKIYQDLDYEIKNKGRLETWDGFAEKLSRLSDALTGDRLLNSVYGEKLAFYYFLAGNFKAATVGYRGSLEKGYPATHLYYDLAVSLKFAGEKKEAEKIMRKTEKLLQEGRESKN